jgi:hypothetical protein
MDLEICCRRRDHSRPSPWPTDSRPPSLSGAWRRRGSRDLGATAARRPELSRRPPRAVEEIEGLLATFASRSR